MKLQIEIPDLPKRFHSGELKTLIRSKRASDKLRPTGARLACATDRSVVPPSTTDQEAQVAQRCFEAPFPELVGKEENSK